MTAELLAHALQAKRSGSSWTAKCPSHEDRNPSLSIREANGKVLVHCHAGCAQPDVINKLKSIGVWELSQTGKSSIIETYDYTDNDGSLLYQVVRYEPKNFKQRRPDGSGGWTWQKSQKQVLYRLPEVLEAQIVFVVEGERDVETLRERGFVATTNAGGANAHWIPDYTEALRGREVILVPDRDKAGYARVQRIAHALLGNVRRLVYLELEDGKDVSEWFSRGHIELELIAQLEEEGVSQ